jgi:hypothetical protein
MKKKFRKLGIVFAAAFAISGTVSIASAGENIYFDSAKLLQDHSNAGALTCPIRHKTNDSIWFEGDHGRPLQKESIGNCTVTESENDTIWFQVENAKRAIKSED